METHTAGGIGSAFKRFLGGSSLFVTDYTYTEEEGYGRVAFAEVNRYNIYFFRHFHQK
jgi:uncharacterized protein (AIM24 family)